MYLKNLLKRIKIAAYHSILDEPGDPYAVSTDNFRSQMKWIADNGYTVVSLKDALQLLNENVILTRYIVLTFDDGFADFMENALPLLNKYNFCATVFMPAAKVGQTADWRSKDFNHRLMDWESLKEVVDDGHMIGSHGFSHCDLTKLNRQDLDKEIKLSKEIIQEKLNVEVESFSYPWGMYTVREIEAVKHAGYRCAVGVGGQRHNSYFTNHFKLKRILVENKDSILGFAGKLR